jgi:hypothetical protein
LISFSAFFTRRGSRHAWKTPMERTISYVVLLPWADPGSLKSGAALLVLSVSNAMLLDALAVEDTSQRTPLVVGLGLVAVAVAEMAWEWRAVRLPEWLAMDLSMVGGGRR